VRIQFEMEGGLAYFPGLSKPVTLDSQQMPEEEAARWARLVQAAHFFDRPAVVGAPRPGAADYRRYTITVEEGGRHHTVQLTDPVQDPDLKALLDALKTAAARGRG
jgi:hypothetical protein